MVIMKALATITAAGEPDESGSPNGSFEAILSTPATDRDGDQLAQDDWKTPLPDRIHIDLDHEMSVAGTVGSAEPYFDPEGNLRIKGTYASTPRAQEVRTLVNEGHITTMSVAFMTDRSTKDAATRELLNGAFVAVPSNRDAKVLSSKAFEAIEEHRKAAGDKPKPPYGDVPYADPGYLDADGKPAEDGKGVPRYPLNNESRARAAWSYINMPKNAGQYSASQLSAIKDKIKAALRKYGVDISEDKAFIDALVVVDAFLYADVKGMAGADIFDSVDVDMKAGARNSSTDSKMIQAIHDASSLLGAACNEPAPDNDDGSDDGANKAADKVAVVDLDMFQRALDALTTKSSGHEPGEVSPTAPAEASAESPAETDVSAADDAADKAADEQAQQTAASMLAGLLRSELALSSLEP
jgi:hypothetical protein